MSAGQENVSIEPSAVNAKNLSVSAMVLVWLFLRQGVGRATWCLASERPGWV